ncbi:MAG TPA: hypothetical protein PKH40_05225, partial [Treponemataceae bacterium]|nr:hypothetical protein [Treponemataceae bacterium]
RTSRSEGLDTIAFPFSFFCANCGIRSYILCAEEARVLVKNSTEREIPDLVVLSVPEISNDIKVEAVGEIKQE